jgi:hypothetical protein
MDKDSLIARYEQLREQALGQLFTSGQGLGLALFMQKGMTAWTLAWTENTSKRIVTHFTELNIKNQFTGTVSKQITMVLTNMIVDLNRKETRNGFTSDSEGDKRTPSTKSLPLCPPIIPAAGLYKPREYRTTICPSATRRGAGLAPATDCHY